MKYSKFVIKAITKIKNDQMNLQFIQIGQLFSKTDTFFTKLLLLAFITLEYMFY